MEYTLVLDPERILLIHNQLTYRSSLLCPFLMRHKRFEHQRLIMHHQLPQHPQINRCILRDNQIQHTCKQSVQCLRQPLRLLPLFEHLADCSVVEADNGFGVLLVFLFVLDVVLVEECSEDLEDEGFSVLDEDGGDEAEAGDEDFAVEDELVLDPADEGAPVGADGRDGGFGRAGGGVHQEKEVLDAVGLGHGESSI